MRARRAGRRGLLRDDARARIRTVGRGDDGDRGGPRVPAVRAPRRTSLSPRDGGLHAPRAAGVRPRGDPGGARGGRAPPGAGGGVITAPVAAVVVASRRGARLERALGSVAWAEERVVVDPGTSPAESGGVLAA